MQKYGVYSGSRKCEKNNNDIETKGGRHRIFTPKSAPASVDRQKGQSPFNEIALNNIAKLILFLR